MNSTIVWTESTTSAPFKVLQLDLSKPWGAAIGMFLGFLLTVATVAVLMPIALLLHWIIIRVWQISEVAMGRVSLAIEEMNEARIRKKSIRNATTVDIERGNLQCLSMPGALQTLNIVEPCCICLEPMLLIGVGADIRILQCQHILHRSCYRRLRKSGRSNCPLCRKSLFG